MAEPDDTRRVKGRGPKPPPEDPDETPGDRRLRVALIAITLGLGAMFVFAEFLPMTAPRLPYYEFKTQVRSGRVVEVLIGERVIRGRYRGTAHTEPGTGPFARAPRMDFETIRVNDPQLIPLLDERQVRYGGMLEGPAAGPWMMTILGLLALTLFGRSLMKRFQGQTGSVLAFGRNKGRAIADDEVKVRFDDVAGVDEAKEELREVVEFLKNPEKFTRIGARIPKGVLLVGPPGTGKTLLARAVAGEAGVAFFSLSGSEFVEMFVGVGAARVRDLFENAKGSAPCIVFIDELDALGRARGANMLGTNEEREQTLNQLLVEMDGFETNKGVILLAATNRPEILDAALLRPGRFDRQVLVDRPDRKGREAILRVHAKQVKVSTDLDFDDVASRTPGFAGADLANVVNEAALLAARRDRAEVSRAEIEEAIERVSGGLERRSRIISPEERQRVAYHEVGHAIVGQVLPGGARVAKISVVPRGVAALGYTMKLPTEDRYLTTESELRAQLAGLLGGRVAEQLVFGEASTGAGNDLQRATDLARAMVAEYGMSRVIGPITVAAERSPLFSPTEGAGRMREHGEHLADTVDEEVKRLVEQAETTAREILSVRRADLDRIARALIEHEYLNGAQFRAMLEGPAADVPSAGVPPVAELP